MSLRGLSSWSGRQEFTAENARFFDQLGSPGGAAKTGPLEVTIVRYPLEVRLTPTDVGQRFVIRWRRPSPGDGEQIAETSWAFSRSMRPLSSRSAPPTGSRS